MYLRIIRGQTQPGHVVEVARRWEAFIGARIRAMPGFRQGSFGGSAETAALVAVSVWDAPPDAGTLNRAVHAFTTQERALIRGQLTIEDDEILGQLTG